MSSVIEPYTLLRSALALFGKPPAELDSKELQRVQTQARNEYIIETRVLNAPEAASVIVPEKELDLALREVSQRFKDKMEFEQALMANGLSVDTLKAALYRQCKVNTVLEIVSKHTPKISDVEVGIYYHSHPEKFHRPEQRVARHILISINPDYPENIRENALQRIEVIAETLNRKKHKFADLALKNSECPTAMNGGELGTVVAGKLYPELDKVLFTLKEKEISSVVETEIGFHLIQCVRIIHAETMSLKNAAPKIRALMQERQRRVCQKAWIASLSKEII